LGERGQEEPSKTREKSRQNPHKQNRLKGARQKKGGQGARPLREKKPNSQSENHAIRRGNTAGRIPEKRITHKKSFEELGKGESAGGGEGIILRGKKKSKGTPSARNCPVLRVEILRRGTTEVRAMKSQTDRGKNKSYWLKFPGTRREKRLEEKEIV